MTQKKSIQILIEQCPLCTKGEHTYQLIIQRTIVLGLSGDKEKQKTLTCTFICPTTGEKFEAPISLEKAPHEDILSVHAK